MVGLFKYCIPLSIDSHFYAILLDHKKALTLCPSLLSPSVDNIIELVTWMPPLNMRDSLADSREFLR